MQRDLEAKLKALQDRMNDVLTRDVATLNGRMKGTGLPGIAAPPARPAGSR